MPRTTSGTSCAWATAAITGTPSSAAAIALAWGRCVRCRKKVPAQARPTTTAAAPTRDDSFRLMAMPATLADFQVHRASARLRSSRRGRIDLGAVGRPGHQAVLQRRHAAQTVDQDQARDHQDRQNRERDQAFAASGVLALVFVLFQIFLLLVAALAHGVPPLQSAARVPASAGGLAAAGPVAGISPVGGRRLAPLQGAERATER